MPIPYKSIDDVPDTYLTKTDADRRKFMKIFNNAYDSAKDDGLSKKDAEKKAYSIAYGVLKKQKGGKKKDKKKKKKKGFIDNRLYRIAVKLIKGCE